MGNAAGGAAGTGTAEKRNLSLAHVKQLLALGVGLEEEEVLGVLKILQTTGRDGGLAAVDAPVGKVGRRYDTTRHSCLAFCRV